MVIAAILSLSACKGETGPKNGFAEYYRFIDSTGKEIVLDSKPQKTAILFSSYAEIWSDCGGEIAVTVGDSVKRGFAPETAVLVNDGAGLKIDMEILLAEEPDFVVVTPDLSAQAEAVEVLSEMGIPTAAFREESMEDYLYILKIFSEILENKEVYEQKGIQVAEDIDSILDSVNSYLKETKNDPVDYLLLRAGSGASSTKAKTAEDHLACAMLDTLGAHNIADEAGDLAEELSLESILISQPDVIFIVPQGDEEAARAYMDEVLSSEGWNALDAVMQDRVIFLDKELFGYKPNDRWAEGYKELCTVLYPELDLN